MSWLWYVLIAIILIGLIILFSEIHIEVVLRRVGQNDLFRVKLRAIFGLVKYRYEIPVIRWNSIFSGVTIKKEEKLDIEKQEFKNEMTSKVNRRTIVKSFEHLQQLVMHTVGLYTWLVNVMGKMKCTELVWVTRIGLGEAADTAVTTGLIWSIKCSLTGFIFQYVRLAQTPQLSVVPLFNEEHFSMDLQGKIKLRVSAALMAGIHLLVRILRVKGGLKVWRNRMTKA